MRPNCVFAAAALSLAGAYGAQADVFSVTVDARENTVREDRLARIALPSGAADVTIAASGAASHSNQGAFAALMVEHKDGAMSVQRAVPIGGSIHFSIANTLNYPLQFYFVDDDPSDNTGAILISALFMKLAERWSDKPTTVGLCADTLNLTREVVML